MDELGTKPTPLPRTSPVCHPEANTSGNQQLKKPVPLPRSSAVKMTSHPSSALNQEDKGSSESTPSSFEDVITKGYNTLTKSLRNKLKSASENVQGKGKAVIETTKNVGLKTERSVRGILHKRQSAVPVVNAKEEVDGVKPRLDRCQSLPTEDIFGSIKFGSPIQGDKYDNAYDSDDEISLPPPEYPPPPLPDESLYDELSTRSSHSGSQGDYYTCPSLISSMQDIDSASTYEDLPDLKHLSLCGGGSDSNSSQSCENVTKGPGVSESDFGQILGINPLVMRDHDRVAVSRSESWSFYDTVHIPKPKTEQYVNVQPTSEQYVNVTIRENEDAEKKFQIKSSDTEHKTTALKPLQPLKFNNKSDSKAVRQQSTVSSTGSEGSSMSVPNELYTNWHPLMSSKFKENINLATNQVKNKFSAKTLFSEFDPLYERLNAETKLDSKVETESLPVLNTDEFMRLEDTFETASLPIPPTRYDSITDESKETPEIPNDVEYFLYQRPITSVAVSDETLNGESKENQAPDESATAENTPCGSPDRELCAGKKRSSNIVRNMKQVFKKVTDTSQWSPGVIRKSKLKEGEDLGTVTTDQSSSEDNLERPVINLASGPLHSGFLFRSPSGGEKQKDFVQKWCQLAEGRLMFSAERNSSNKDVIMVELIYSLQIVRETKLSNDGEDIYCMEISCSQRDKPHLLGSPGTTERRIWMQKLLESLTLVFPPRLTADYTRAGWCYFKEGISGGWVAAWILLHKRTLFFNPSKRKVCEIDLRKARCVVLQDLAGVEGCSRVAVKGPQIRVDGPNCAYYLQMNEPHESRAWCRVIHEAAVDNGPTLRDQQLTKDDLPTIIDKCINFVSAHGSMTEGIYRRSGSNTNVAKLLTAFQKDAWAVQITRNDYTEHDVASVLKRFFRDLPEPLLTTELHKVLCNAGGLECSEEEKVSLYRSQLEKLPPVNYVTVRRLMGHLYHISLQCERNLMPVENLAAIWGPTLMHVETGLEGGWSRAESQVICDLIALYPQLFHVCGAELAREAKIQEVLERYHHSSQTTPQTTRPSGDIKVWVYIGKREGDCVSVTVSPQREALDVCMELCTHMNVYGHELCLLESVLGGALYRPLHHTERVLDTVLRWGYWDDADCKDNCLILVINTLLQNLQPIAKPPVAQCGELRFADLKSKSFKCHLFEFSQAKLCYYKDKAGSIKLGEWKIEDIVWYIGHEPKRNPHTRWAITFINKNNRNKRSKENPFFGYTIAGTAKDEQLRWMAAMLVGEFPHVDLLPKSQLNLLE
ncbi:arf-GAP with Rho-GAP domain, ANK repeat and PH domain-containing protein 3-like isoform X2 [Macrosteles quadrilineatus]|uniref:arf-GAP with Rho-GAP domain, ANK repeat and PH domain-containing protein 3-like isoform X2 n=1 Tax=Macrosteles quadrilineatus TaxID=74068 RepID=UPI0023E251BD|nr:arf-GAP with Rho-GAP domain, ANK repeat and PH domain-containing protein 3-like isoform X2 [Macrosteles quadrilineatus]